MGITNTDGMTIEDIKLQLEKLDRMLRPNIVMCNPDDEQLLSEGIGDIAKVVASELIPAGSAFVIDREKVEDFSYIRKFES